MGTWQINGQVVGGFFSFCAKGCIYILFVPDPTWLFIPSVTGKHIDSNSKSTKEKNLRRKKGIMINLKTEKGMTRKP